MKLLFDDNFSIEISTDITYTRSSSLFSPLKGEWTYPFQIPATPEILLYFKNPHLPASMAQKEPDKTVKLIIGQFLFAIGTFRIIKATSLNITANLNATPGNIPLKVLNQNLNTLDFGSEQINTITVNNSAYFWKLSWSAVNIQTQLNNLIYQWFNCFIFVNGVYKAEIGLLDYRQGNSGRTFAEFKTQMIKNFQEVFVEKMVIAADDDNMYMYSSIALNELKIVFVGYPSLATYDSFGYIQFSKMNYQTIAQDYYNTKIDNEVYVLPEIQDFKLYADGNADFNGVINKRAGQQVLLNSDAFLCKYAVIPQLRLTWIIKKLFSILGLTVKGSFLINANIKKAILLSLYTTDKQSTETKVPFNVHNENVKYANHLPEITVQDFLKYLIDEFAIGIEFNSSTSEAELFFFSEALKNENILDLNNIVSIIPENNNNEIDKIQVSYTLSGDSLAKEEVSPYISVPTKALVEISTEKYVPLELKFPPLTETSVGAVQIEAAGVSPLFNQSKNSSPLRLYFYDNNKAVAEMGNFSLDLTKSTGIYQNLLKEKIDFDQNTVNFTGKALLSLFEIVSFNFKNKILAYNVLWFCEEFTVKLQKERQLYEVELKLKRT